MRTHASPRLRLIRLIRLICLMAACVFAPAVACAQEPAADDGLTRIRLDAEVSRTVDNDVMRAQLAAESEDVDPAALADRLNRTMDWALEQARAESRVTVSTGGYQTFPVYERSSLVRWRASQELRLESKSRDVLVELIGKLQSRLQLKGLSFAVSTERRRAIENELISGALGAFRERAEIVRESLGSSAYRIGHASVQTAGSAPPPMPLQRKLSMASAEAMPPAVEAGTSEVVVRVSGEIVLDE